MRLFPFTLARRRQLGPAITFLFVRSGRSLAIQYIQKLIWNCVYIIPSISLLAVVLVLFVSVLGQVCRVHARRNERSAKTAQQQQQRQRRHTKSAIERKLSQTAEISLP